MKLGLALIAKDEEASLPTLLASVAGAFDEVVLVDTGSEDKTVELFESWAQDEVGAGRLERYVCDTFTWRDDFAAARAYAHSLLCADWEVWADCDDEIRGAHNLRQLAESAPAELAGFIADYDYAHDAHGNVVCRLKRERLVRAGAGEWVGRVHEAQVLEGTVNFIDPNVCAWIHRKQPDGVVPERNLRILTAWEKDEPENPRVLGYLGTEELARGNSDEAVTWFKRYLALKTSWDEERAQIHRKYALALMALDKPEEAIEVALQALRVHPLWPDSYLTLAEAHYTIGEVGRALAWADEVLKRGIPDTLLIIDPTDYVLRPRIVRAASLAAMGQVEQAIAEADQVLAVAPGHPLLSEHYPEWKRQAKVVVTVQRFVEMAQGLMAHDEQLKALDVLEAVPHYAFDAPAVVQLRAELRRRIDALSNPDSYAEHYETGGSKPEDFVPDDQVLELGDRLPRCGFLLKGLLEQAGVAA